MATPAPKLATYADLIALPEDARGEVLAGEIVTSPAPLPRHSKVQGSARRFLGGPFDDDDGHGGPGGWWIFVEVDVALGPHEIVRPDLVGWRRERLPRPGSARPITVVPDWVCEVIPPPRARAGCVTMRLLSAQPGVPHFCLTDPGARVLDAPALHNGGGVGFGVSRSEKLG